MIRETRSKLFEVFDGVTAESNSLDDSLLEHEAILQAVMNGDAQAAKDRMCEHLEHTGRRVRHSLGLVA